MSTLTIEVLNNFTPEKIFDFLNEDFLSEEGDSNPLAIYLDNFELCTRFQQVIMF